MTETHSYLERDRRERKREKVQLTAIPLGCGILLGAAEFLFWTENDENLQNFISLTFTSHIKH